LAFFEEVFPIHYQKAVGAPNKPIRLMTKLLWHERVSKRITLPQAALVHFRKRIGKDGFEKIFQMSVGLHGELALENAVNIDTAVHEKNLHDNHTLPEILAGPR
jgi:IS5 family transposase